ncbi:MAG: AAA family ATPase [Rhodospirillales bacterium]
MADILSFENKPKPSGFIETETALQFLKIIHKAWERRWMAAMVGAPGLGKTKAMRRYCELHPGHAFYYEFAPSDASLSAMLDVLAGMLGAYAVDRGIHNKHRAVAHAIRRRAEQQIMESSNPSAVPDDDLVEATGRVVLLIDEAQELTPAALQGLKALHDQTGVAIVLAGNETVINQFYAGKGMAKPAFAQLDRRIVLRRKVHGLVPADVAALARHHGIGGTKELSFLKRLASFGHGLALPDNVIREARFAARNRPIGPCELEEAARSLGVEL